MIMDVLAYRRSPKMGKRSFIEFVKKRSLMMRNPRKGAFIVASFNISFYASLVIFYIYNALIGLYYIFTYDLTFRTATTIDIFTLDYTFLEAHPLDIISSTVFTTGIAIVFVYFNFKLLKATKRKHLQSIIYWLAFHSFHLTYFIIYCVRYGLIKKSLQHLVLGTLNSIYSLSIWLVKRFYDKVRKPIIYNTTLTAADPAVCSIETIIKV